MSQEEIIELRNRNAGIIFIIIRVLKEQTFRTKILSKSQT